MTVFESLLNNVFVVERRVRTSDAQGGWVIGYVPITPIQGRLRPASSSEILSAQREERHISHVLYVEAGTDIERGDKVTLGDLIVEIKALREPSKSGEHLEIDALEVQREVSLEPGS